VLTQCPQCETIYRLSASELGSAQGFVECGECAEQFNALHRLADEPSFAKLADSGALNEVAKPPAHSSSGPAFTLMDVDDSEHIADQSDEGKHNPSPIPIAEQDDFPNGSEPAFFDFAVAPDEQSATATPIDADTIVDVGRFHRSPRESEAALEGSPIGATTIDLGSGGTTQTLPDSEHAILFTDPGAEPAPGSSPEIDDVPAILQKDVAALHRSRSPLRWLWTSISLLFFICLAGQIGWNFRAPILKHIPQAQPIYTKVCAKFNCEVTQSTHEKSVELVSRDVRDHPQYRNTLLVNATLINRSEFAAEFPIIQLGLHGQTGQAIGVRRFEPHEYLDKSIDIAAGMPANRPIYIVLEVAGVDRSAVSFEFDFL